MSTVSLDPQRQQEAKAYARISHRLLVVEVALSALYTAAWLFLGWSTWLIGSGPFWLG